MKRLLVLVALLFAAFTAAFAPSGALALEVPAHGGQWVVDTARLLPPAEKDKLGAELRRYAEASGNQIVVLTVPSLEGEDIAGYANKAARAWGVGQKDGNTGVLIVVARAEAKVRFEVGRGLEDRLPDVLCKRIQRDVTVPHFKAGRFAQGLSESVKAMQQALAPADGAAEGNQTLPAPVQKPAPKGGFSWLTLGLLVLAVVLVFALFNRHGGGGPGGPGGFGGGDGRGGSFLVGMLLGLLSSRWRGGGGGGFGGGGGDGGFSGGGGDFGGGGSDSGFGGGDDNS